MAKKNPIKFLLLPVFFLLSPLSVLAASLFISPPGGNFSAGDSVVAKVSVSGDVSLNAISGEVVFPPDLFSIQSVIKTGSVLNFWVTEPTFASKTGVVSFEGVALSGFSGNSGTVVTVVLKAIKPGSGKVFFRSGQILANDGQGTDITESLAGANFTIEEAPSAPPPSAPPPVKEVVPVLKEPTVEPALLKQPEISIGKKYGQLSVVGLSSYPGVPIVLTFVSESGVRIFITGTTDTDGSFNILIPQSLKRGVYGVTAVLAGNNGEKSENSNIVTVSVGSMFSDIDWKIWLIILSLILAILYLLLRTRSHFRTRRGSRQTALKEVRDAENWLHKSFDGLRNDLSRLKYKADPSGHEQLKEIKKDIDSAEKEIDEKIKNIEV